MHSSVPRYWTSVIIQGRHNSDTWVTSLKISYTINGKKWYPIEDDGKVYEGNTDRTSKVRIAFPKPTYARTIRIHP